MRAHTFKELVRFIAYGADIDTMCGLIGRSFEANKISWNDHELLFKLLARD